MSLLLLMHLLAVFTAPWALTTGAALPPDYRPPAGQTEPPSDPNRAPWQNPIIPRALHSFFTPYENLLYINHGYNFFAPDPAGNKVIRWEVRQPTGEAIQGEFPNKDQQWPRLFYHRHMMLAEQTPNMGPRAGELCASHVATVHGGNSSLSLYLHRLLQPQQVKEGMKLEDPSTYQFLGSVNGQPRPDGQSERRSEEPIVIPGARQ